MIGIFIPAAFREIAARPSEYAAVVPSHEALRRSFRRLGLESASYAMIILMEETDGTVTMMAQSRRPMDSPGHHAEFLAVLARAAGKLKGHFAYYGITGNSSALGRFRSAAKGIWRHWLSRRKRGRRMPWARFYRVLERYPLPPAIAIHSVCRLVAKT